MFDLFRVLTVDFDLFLLTIAVYPIEYPSKIDDSQDGEAHGMIKPFLFPEFF
jgi:hypothetical protein